MCFPESVCIGSVCVLCVVGPSMVPLAEVFVWRSIEFALCDWPVLED